MIWNGKESIQVHLLGFPKIRGPLLGIPIIRLIIFLGSIMGFPIRGNYHFFEVKP